MVGTPFCSSARSRSGALAPARSARCTAESPCRSSSAGSAPTCSRKLTTLVCPVITARCSGVWGCRQSEPGLPLAYTHLPSNPSPIGAPHLVQVIGDVDNTKVLGTKDDMGYLLNDTGLPMDDGEVQRPGGWVVKTLA